MFDKQGALNKLNRIKDLNLAEDMPMASFSNFKLGGPADLYIRPQTEGACMGASG